jgi:hypothetical protein
MDKDSILEGIMILSFFVIPVVLAIFGLAAILGIAYLKKKWNADEEK